MLDAAMDKVDASNMLAGRIHGGFYDALFTPQSPDQLSPYVAIVNAIQEVTQEMKYVVVPLILLHTCSCGSLLIHSIDKVRKR
jgi:hypothetical protein